MHSIRSHLLPASLAILAFTLVSFSEQTPVHADDDVAVAFDSADEAMGVGAAYLRAKKYDLARPPLEAALELSTSEAERLKVYEMLLPVYRQIPEFEPFRDAAEFIIEKSDKAYQRSMTRRSFISFAYNRGQIDELVERYEEKLTKEPNDEPTVYLLAEIYSNMRRDPKRTIELLEQLQKLQSKGQVSDPDSMSASEKQRMVLAKSNLAREYLRGDAYRKAAKLYEAIAPLDPTTQAWNLKEAAIAWMKEGNPSKALKLAERAEVAPAEARNDQLTHFFHRHLGDLFMKLALPAKAIPHYEIAIEKTTIAGYKKDTAQSLREAQQAAEPNKS
ncbi:tetratricopeptide repeat protein [Novipirellula artificiosorum]|nr:hypothetical protein [Novipirellula artificiosorum]